jgi:hypothetical protein
VGEHLAGERGTLGRPGWVWSELNHCENTGVAPSDGGTRIITARTARAAQDVSSTRNSHAKACDTLVVKGMFPDKAVDS